MENQPPAGSGSASAWLNRRSPAPAGPTPAPDPAPTAASEQELTRLKERLGFYERFDQIIQDNVARAGELLRNAVSVRESAEQEIATAREEVERSRVSERSNYRTLLSELLDEVTTMQVHVERLARKVADALDEVEAALPAPELERLPGARSPLMAIGAAAPEGGGATYIEAEVEAAAAEGAAQTAPVPTETEAAAFAPAETVVEPPAATSGDLADAVAIEQADIPRPAEPKVTAESFHDADAAMAIGEDDEVEGGVIVPDAMAEAVRFAEVAAEPILAEEAEVEPEAGDSFAATSLLDASTVTIGPEGEPYAPNVIDEAARFAELAAESIAEEEAEAEPESGDGFALPELAAVEPPLEVAPAANAGAAEAMPAESVEAEPSLKPRSAELEPSIAPDASSAPDATPSVAAADTGSETPASSEVPSAGAPAEVVSEPRGEIRPFPTGIPAQPAFRRTGTGELRFPSPLPPAAPRPVIQPAAARGSSTTVLVHGVPRATTALSLKRYLEALPHVGAVEPREYAEGILRLQVLGDRPVLLDDLRGWPDGAGLETVHLRDDLVEVRLPH